MFNIDPKIIKFIKAHHVLTIATTVDNKPYCANCFYAYMEKENILVFTSDRDTKHAKDFLANSHVAGSIVLETKIIGKIQGIQFNGIISEPADDLFKQAKQRYLKRFPVAVLMNTTFWIVEPSFIKMTDNRLGFGKKLIWTRSENKTNII
ncbi:MAG: pyridoxamine 5'-phosphate oxidase family protein [Bacteroidia bacterium]|nr:pyridoxamine 5'-phosphate oxidase family protein [Bacteroidia bacterium]